MEVTQSTSGPPSAADHVDTDLIVRINLKALRRDQGLTQQAVAGAMAQLGFDWLRQTVSQIESGIRRVALGELVALSFFFRRTPGWFLQPHGSTEVRIHLGNRAYNLDEWREVVDPDDTASAIVLEEIGNRLIEIQQSLHPSRRGLENGEH